MAQICIDTCVNLMAHIDINLESVVDLFRYVLHLLTLSKRLFTKWKEAYQIERHGEWNKYKILEEHTLKF